MTSSNRTIIDWEIEKGRPPIKVYECEDINEKAPDGFPVLVSFVQVRVITPAMSNHILSLMAKKTGGDLPMASTYLHEAVGGHATLAECIAVVKDIAKHPTKANSKDAPRLVLKNAIWMSLPDWTKYKVLPHIEAIDPNYRREQVPPIEGNIEWPKNFDGPVLNPSGEDVDAPPANKMAKRNHPLDGGQVTTITSQTPRRSSGIVKHNP